MTATTTAKHLDPTHSRGALSLAILALNTFVEPHATDDAGYAALDSGADDAVKVLARLRDLPCPEPFTVIAYTARGPAHETRATLATAASADTYARALAMGGTVERVSISSPNGLSRTIHVSTRRHDNTPF